MYNDNSGDCNSGENMNQPSCSNDAAGRGSIVPSRSSTTRNADLENRNRRIVMRIEFNDSDDTDDASSVSSNGPRIAADGDDNVNLDTRPSCSSSTRNRRSSTRASSKPRPPAHDHSDSDGLQRICSRRIRSKRGVNQLHFIDESEDSFSSSGSEIQQRSIRARNKKQRKLLISEDERNEQQKSGQDQADVDCGFSSDSSSNELLEKCPICLLTFRQQEIGTPATCEHNFCAACIEAWSKNMQTCPIDRLAFHRIIVRDTYGDRNIVREIHLDPNKSKKELNFDDEDNGEANNDEDVTNCEICNSPEREDVMLLCDSCNQGYHMDCLDPPLNVIPEGSWYCDNCVDSNDEDDDVDLELAEDLNMLYEDIRGMGLPETRLRVREVQQPRILRTRENERIRAAVLRRTLAASTSETTTTTTRTTTRCTRRTRTTTTHTTKSQPQREAPARRRRTRHRTYVVEYDLNNFDEKFAIKSTKKVIRRRRRRKKTRKSRRQATGRSSDCVRMSASKRLAEQLGVKMDSVHGSHLSGGSAASFTLFGNANDLEYFSDSDGALDGAATLDIDNGNATAVQTSVRIATSLGALRTRKSLILGKTRTTQSATSDLLSSIIEMQDRWHDASRNLSDVHISADGSLRMPQRTPVKAAAADLAIQQVPLYQRGGAGPNFGRSGGGGGGGGGGGNYNNRYGGNNNYRNGSDGGGGGGGGSANQYQRNSAGSMSNISGDAAAGAGYGSQSFGSNNSNNNNGSHSSTPNTNFTPFNVRMHQRNLQQQQQQRNQNIQQRHLLYTGNDSGSAGGEGAAVSSADPNANLSQQQQLFSGLPAPINHQQSSPLSRLSMPAVLSVPPPPAPPPSLSWNSSLFKLNSDYAHKEANEDGAAADDGENCPNFSIYSQESQAVAKATEQLSTQQTTDENVKVDDDINEDLVQLDDDDDIPLPPYPIISTNDDDNADTEIYKPENPTDELDGSSNQNCTGADHNQDISSSAVSNSNLEPISSDVPGGSSKDPEDDETKTRSAADRRKGGVLELYDDSDWEELDIDKPKEFEKPVDREETGGADVKPKLANDETTVESEKVPSNVTEQDRSYTPCLDEKNVEEEAASAGHQKGSAAESAAPSKKSGEAERMVDIETELISDEDDLTNENDGKRRSRSRRRNEAPATTTTMDSKSKRGSKRDKENAETFKKVGKRQKDRNYRGDKQRSRSRRSRSRTPVSVSRNRSRSRSRSPRSHRRGGSRSKSHSRSRSQSLRARRQRTAYNDRDRDRGRDSRDRGRGLGNTRGRNEGQRFNYRNTQQHQQRNYPNPNQQQNLSHYQRPKRRELPRYDVRNVVGVSRQQQQKDRYGRDAARDRRSCSNTFGRRQRSCSYSRSCSQSRSPSRPASHKRQRSFSISPSPVSAAAPHHGSSISPALPALPVRRFGRSPSPLPPPMHHNSSLHSPISLRSRSHTPPQMNGGRKLLAAKRSPSYSPRFTPRLSRSRSKSSKNKKKKKKAAEKKKKNKKRAVSSSPAHPAVRQRRISRQRDPFDDADDFLGPQLSKKQRRHSPKKQPTVNMGEAHWSPSPTPSPSAEQMNFAHDMGGDKNTSWTPPLASPPRGYATSSRRSISPLTAAKKLKRKRDKSKKKKKLFDKHQRKEKRRKRRTQTPELLPSKEVFASGNNILVSVSFNKEANSNTTTAMTNQQQTTVVTVPPTRDDLLVSRRSSIDNLTNVSGAVTHKKVKKDKLRKRKKIEAKPVAIIDLERSPFQVHQEPADVIVLTDSEDANDNHLKTRRERRRGSIALQATDHDALTSELDKTPQVECLATILETSYENLTQTTGPKTPPEPPLVKFNLPAKKCHQVRNNPLHDDTDDINSADELETNSRPITNQEAQPHTHDNMLPAQKIGPNTPPESGPCSPDVYDPFEPTKSPSLSPSSPPPAQLLDPTVEPSVSSGGAGAGSVENLDQKHCSLSDELTAAGTVTTPTLSSTSNSVIQTSTSTTMNPVDLVMALMNKPSNSGQQEPVNKSSCDAASQYLNNNNAICIEDKSEEVVSNTIKVLSNVLLASGSAVSTSQHIPVISSPTPPATTMVKKMPGSSVASSSSGIISSSALRNGSGCSTGGAANAGTLDDSFNMDIESPYSPGSADYEDLFEPPPDSIAGGVAMKRSKGSGGNAATGKTEMFDNLFGSSSPVGQLRMSSRFNSSAGKKQQSRATNKNDRKSKVKVGKSGDELVKVYDDVPNSAVELQVKDKFLRKLNRQERVVEEVKLVLKPHFNKKLITKEDYKDIMRRAVPKICHSRSGEINPHKIKNLIDAYVKKFRAKHKKLSLLNTGQVSSAVKCAAYLKKL